MKTEMKHKVGKDPVGGSKERKEVENESPLSSMFQKQQTTNELQKTRVYQRESYDVILERGNIWGWTVLDPQQFQDCITTAQPTTQVTTQVVSVQKSHVERHDQDKGVKTSVFKRKWKVNRSWLELRTVEHDNFASKV